MVLSLFFAKLLGLYLLIMALLMLLRKKEIEEMAHEVCASRSVLCFGGVINLLLGLTIVIAHPIWEWSWRVIITLIGYLSILKGMMRLGFYKQSKIIETMLIHRYWWMFALTLILGAYLTYHGFSDSLIQK